MPTPELIVGLVGAVGSNLTAVEELLEKHLTAEAGYQPQRIRLSDALRRCGPAFWRKVWRSVRSIDQHDPIWWNHDNPRDQPPGSKVPEHVRIKALMDAAKRRRAEAKSEDVLVRDAVSQIRAHRRRHGNLVFPSSAAFVLRSLKHPAEVKALRGCYGHSFLLLGVHSTEASRSTRLSAVLQKTSELIPPALTTVVNYLIRRDSYEEDAGQRVRDTFHLADAFVDGDAPERELNQQLKRFLRLVFGHPCITPTADEYAMFLAHAAAARTASLARQVGAALADDKGEVLSLGSNEVPKPGGGLVFESDERWACLRDSHQGFDTSHREKMRVLADLAQRLEVDLPAAALKKKLKGSLLLDIIEFYREVHAETAALLDAARRGAKTQGATLFVTTFPCHDCAKHVIASGVSRIVYVAPYPKSKTLSFFSEAFRFARQPADQRVLLEPFVGVGPRIYRDVFGLITSEGREYTRKDDRGHVVAWKPAYRWRSINYLRDEAQLLETLVKAEK